MRKLFAPLVALVLTLSTLTCAFASNDGKTDGRTILEFYNLYGRRLYELDEEFGTSISKNSMGMYMNIDNEDSDSHKNEYSVFTMDGTFDISIPDFEIVSFSTTLFDLSNGRDKYAKESLLKASMAYASLEYDSMDEYFENLSAEYGMSEDTSFVINKSVEFSDMIADVIYDEKKCIDLCSASGNRVLLASLNYNYYLEYGYGQNTDGSTLKIVSLIAEKNKP